MLHAPRAAGRGSEATTSTEREDFPIATQRRRQTRAIGRNPHAFPPAEHNAIVRERNATARHYALLQRRQREFWKARATGDVMKAMYAHKALLSARYYPEKVDPTLRHSILAISRQKQLRAEHESARWPSEVVA